MGNYKDHTKLAYIRKKKWDDLTYEEVRFLRINGILNGFGGA